ncbi:tyrosine-type recombinase/integrase [Chryseobacterium indoltheticum]|uniref:site-specific integrase n=1 Tax=Chryseobacterium indoltheticum TaxID=254 RepID=UPI0028E72B79|nr:tyrosine-type recombinase/integrase [Chryseobacterium indoltheticum]
MTANQLIPFIKVKDAQKIFAPMEHTFYLKNEPDKFGKKPIYINVNLNNERKRISTKIKVHDRHWDFKNSFIIDSEETHDDHLILKQINSKITSIRIKHRLSEVPLTMINFLEQLKNAPSNFDFIEFYQSIKKLQKLSDKTVIKHDGIFNKLKKHFPVLLFQDISIKLFDKIRYILKEKENNNESTINTNISVLKKYLGIALDYGIQIPVDLDKIPVGPTAGRIIWLTESEINKLSEYYFSSFIPEHYKLSLGYFLIACYTGLRISDVKARDRVEMLEEFIRFASIKSKKEQLLYIIPAVHKIIDSNEELFDIFRSEVTINRNLKDIAKVCGITKKLYFHVGRHSFATNYLLRGGKVENLQVILAHTKITTTMKYVHIVDNAAALSMRVMMD